MDIGHVEATATNDHSVRLLLLDGPRVDPARIIFGMADGQPHLVGEVWVDFGQTEETRRDVHRVEVKLVEPLTPTALRRFPWTKALAAADAALRAHQFNTIDAHREAGRRAAAVAGRDAPRPKGRPPLPHDHYAAVARLHATLVSQGNSPDMAIARQYEVTRSTAAGWIRKARARGLIPPSRRGKAG